MRNSTGQVGPTLCFLEPPRLLVGPNPQTSVFYRPQVRGGEPAETHQLFELPLPVAELLVHPEADLRALQRGDDLQLRVFVLDDVVLQHQTQDLHRNVIHHHRFQLNIFRYFDKDDGPPPWSGSPEGPAACRDPACSQPGRAGTSWFYSRNPSRCGPGPEEERHVVFERMMHNRQKEQSSTKRWTTQKNASCSLLFTHQKTAEG